MDPTLNNRTLLGISREQFKQLSPAAKAAYCNIGDRPFHTLVAQQFNRDMLDKLGRLATRIRRIAKSKTGMQFLAGLLDHKRAMLYFSQPSSRTFLSFYAACQILGIKPGEVRDPATSSEVKGESIEDTIRTFSSYFDMIIMRTPASGFAEDMAWMLSNTDRPIPILNAGSGKDQHPTQALLDIYTLQRSFEKIGGIDGKTVVFVGDLKRGRTVRSLACLLLTYANVRQIFVAPEHLQIENDIVAQLQAAGSNYELRRDFAATIAEADAIYMTRIQDEWDQDSDRELASSYNSSDYHFTEAHLNQLKQQAVILHPLPRRQEVAAAVDNDPRAVYWRQVRNGMWIRAALIATTFGRDQEICSYYQLNYG